MKNFLLLIVFSAIFSFGFAQTINIKASLNWDESPIIHNPTGNFPTEIWNFESATFSDVHPSLPIYSGRTPISSYGKARARLIDAEYETFDKKTTADDQYLSENIIVNTKVLNDRGNYYIYYSLIPIRTAGSGNFERLTSFEIRLDFEATANGQARTDYTYNSELSNGSIYKFGVAESGVHKITYDSLKRAGIDIDNINPDKIRILGIGGGILPELIDTERYDDVKELPIQIVGGEDGQFNDSDYILFYAEGPDKWFYDSFNEVYNRPKNFYSNLNYYYVKIGAENGLRITNQPSVSGTAYTSTEHDWYTRFEEDRFNLLNEANGAQGSGRDWYGDPFNPTRERSYDFSIPNLASSASANLKVAFAGRGKTTNSFQVEALGQQFSKTINGVNWTNVESLYARIAIIDEPINLNNNNFTVTIKYPSVGDGTNIGWLDYIQVNTRANNSMSGDQFMFRDQNTMNHSSSTFQLSNVSGNTVVWDITDPLHPIIQDHSNNGTNLSFGTNTQDILKEFVAFNPNANFPSPIVGEQIENQNIHGIDDVHMAIIYHKDFAEAAQKLAEHRRAHSNLDIELVDIDQVFNEFACARRDMTAIRDFVKMLYDRNPDKFKYLLLFGDGSFDFKNVTGLGKNFVPPFETRNSLDPIRAFPSDDFFGLLTEGEGAELIGALDIAVGRIPVRTALEADIVVNKIIAYDTNPEHLGDWRNRVTFVADDEDNSIHVTQADGISENLRLRERVFNVNKIFFDAYQQISTSGGERFPKATEAIDRDIFKGTMIVNYMGHGGSRGWAQERVLTNSDIEDWNNTTSFPLFVTATCSFTGYDEPSITSAGEQVFLKDNSGAIALYTTTRAVYSSANRRLTTAVFDSIFQSPGQEVKSIGEILRISKNSNSADTLQTNSRKFALIGDPSMQLAIPTYNIATTKINGADIDINFMDTIRALQRVTIEGVVTDFNGNIINDFNGTVQPTIYDKVINVSTLGQDPGSFPIKNFNLQQNIIFRGNASVTNGKFSFTFVVPKDINYELGLGRISYYAHDGENMDARGYFDRFVIGSTDPNAINDDQGPLVEVFMNNESFAPGGITSPNPTLLVKLSDDNGINVVGNSIGHDLTGVLNENTQETYILNDFYESELDDYTKGEVRFPLFNLEPGLYTIKVKAWDVANNSGEGFTEFIVASDEDIALDYVLNYPNPFTTSTNFQFEHNIKDQGLDVQIQIFTISGRIVKTISERLFTDGGRISGIHWDGTDDYGGRLAKGVYLYKVKVRSDDLKTSESDFEKLVILK